MLNEAIAFAKYTVKYVAAGITRGDPSTFIMLAGWATWVWLLFEIPRRWFRMRKGRIRDALDAPLLWWTKKDCLSIRDFLAGGVLGLGRVGSGKTSSLKLLARKLLEYGNSSILVLCAKSGEAEEWLELCFKTGRLKDVVRFGIHEFTRFNMLAYEANRTGDGAGQVSNIVRFIMEMRSVILRRPEGTGGDSEFWRKQDELGITHAVTALHHAGYEITAQAIQDVILSAPTVANYKTLPGWADRACVKVLEQAAAGAKTAAEQHDCQLARDHFLTIWPEMAPATRGSVLVGINSTLTPMNSGIARELFGTRSNTTPAEQIEGRKIVIVDYPPAEFQDLSKCANLGLKQIWQRDVLRRKVTPDSPLAVIWGDDAACWISDGDSDYLSRCRSARGSMVYISQSLDSFMEVMPGEKARSAINALLANFGSKLIFALGDSTAANWASELCGKEIQLLGGGGTQYGETNPFNFRGLGQYSQSSSEQWLPLVQPGEFINGFRTGAAVNNFKVDALLIRSGASFSNGMPIVRVEFDQRASDGPARKK